MTSVEQTEARSAPAQVPWVSFAALACAVVGWSSLLLQVGRSLSDPLYSVALVIFPVGTLLGGALGWHATRHAEGRPGGWMAAAALASAFTVTGLALVYLVIGAIGAAS